MVRIDQFVQGRTTVAGASGQFFVDVEVRAQSNSGAARQLRALVDPTSRYSWIPGTVLEDLGIMRRQPITFVDAHGGEVSRVAGYASVSTAGAQTMATVVFGDPGDPTILGTHAVDGMNLVAEPAAKRLVAGGPLPAPAAVTA